MPKPYSKDLREKVFEIIDSGISITKSSKIFNINRQTIYNWLNLKKDTGKIEAKSGYQKGHSHKINDLAQFEKFLCDNRNKTLKQLADLWPKKISAMT